MPNFISCSISFLTRVFNTIGLTAEHILAGKANNLPKLALPRSVLQAASYIRMPEVPHLKVSAKPGV
ncbi:hypothetical protein, partial [Bifidobacterium longum]|uniref:hypothetical protein n=1 Tax=Bifidobacterium longum TaxID=216816 RepID=UPI001A95510F